MIDLKQIQKDVYQNKLDKGFNVTDINKEFCLMKLNPTGVIYIRNNKTHQYIDAFQVRLRSQHGKAFPYQRYECSCTLQLRFRQSHTRFRRST